MLTVHDVARFLLSKSSMSHKKLQKLCYYAQAWYLANYGRPLVPNRFEAWVHGPVSPDLYTEYREWGWTEIPKVEHCPENINKREEDILNKVYEVYGKFTGDELEAFTHKELPWLSAREGYSSWEYSREPISLKIMRNYYGEKIGKKHE